MLIDLAKCFNNIHDNDLIHGDFHPGNVLVSNLFFITDMGLCKHANQKLTQNNEGKLYGVLPYVAPEVLRGKDHTQASDIYGFGIIALEVITGLSPYYNIAHDEYLAIKICQGLRPISKYQIPQLLSDIINQCLDANPLN
ncbi:6354_t:CDS:1, partial [Funneliformis geosporum]